MSPKINVYLPDDLAAEVKAAGIPVSAVCQQALADAVAAGQGVEVPPAGQGADTGPDDLADSLTRRAYGVGAAARELAAGEPTTVDLVAALAASGGLALAGLGAADIEPRGPPAEPRAREAPD